MKKFTSLFALLAGLCVYNAQADVTIYVYSSNPANQSIHWFDAAGQESTWNSEKIQDEMTSFILGDATVYKKTFSSFTSPLKVIFHDEYGNQTDAITLNDGDNYYYYFGNKHYLTSDALKLAGPFNNWGGESFTINNLTTWTYKWTPNEDAVPFKIIAKRINDNWTGVEDKWLGYSDSNLESNNSNPFITVNAPQGWLTNGDQGNFVLNHASTGYQQYRLTATWNPNSNFAWGWTLKIEGIPTYTVGNNTYDVTDNNVLTLTDGSAFSATTPFTASSATYSRTSSYEWGTLCLPFEIKNLYEGVTFYSLSAVDETNKVLTFTPIEEAISAGEPVVYKSTSKSLTISENNVNVSPIVNEVSYDNGWTLYGSFVAMSNVNPESGKYLYYIANDQFYKSKENANVPAYRAYFIADVNLVGNTQAPIRIEVADSENIQFVEHEDGTVKAYYDLQGRKLDGARKGLVIENGKIIMVK